MLGVTVEHNGYQGGDSGHGGYVKINIKDLGGTNMTCKLKMGDKVLVDAKCYDDFDSIELSVFGSTERATLVDALKMVIKELEHAKHLESGGKEIFLDLSKDEEFDGKLNLDTGIIGAGNY